LIEKKIVLRNLKIFFGEYSRHALLIGWYFDDIILILHDYFVILFRENGLRRAGNFTVFLLNRNNPSKSYAGYVNVPSTMRYILKNRNLLLLFVASGLFFINEMLLMPTLPLYLSELGYSHLALGSVLGAFALGVLVMRPVAGLVTDRKTRKLSPLYLLSNSFVYLLGVRFFHGIGITFFTTASPTLITDIAPPRHRAEILGHMSMDAALCFSTRF
jgi:hypothetical protein